MRSGRGSPIRRGRRRGWGPGCGRGSLEWLLGCHLADVEQAPVFAQDHADDDEQRPAQDRDLLLRAEYDLARTAVHGVTPLARSYAAVSCSLASESPYGSA